VNTRAQADVVVENHGSLFAFTPVTAEARDWFSENVASEGWQWLGPSLCVDHRYAPDLVAGLVAAGLEVQ